jgi:predicted NBD/HSP70 family sugar kinase
MVGASSLRREIAKRLEAGETSMLSRVDPAPEQIATAARAADPLAREVLSVAGGYLGTAVANLVNLLNPARVILGGSLPVLAGEHLLAPMRETLARRTLGRSFDATEVVVSELGEDAMVVGAATQVLEAALHAPSLLVGPAHDPTRPNHAAVSSTRGF